jgi:predicted patatin/cPLA2 family phospholipase
MNGNTALYLGGGVMNGVFSTGITTELENADIYDSLSSVYSASAGAYNAAFFLARQSILAARTYWEDLGNGFINPLRFINGTAVDIDHLDWVVRNTKPLDIDTLEKQDIPFWVKVLNKKTCQVQYLDGTENTFNTLKSAVSIVPYYHARGQDFVDADIKEPIGLENLLDRNPKSKIILVINHQPERGALFYFENILHGLVGTVSHRELPMMKFFMQKAASYYTDIKRAISDEQIILIHPPKDNPTRSYTKDPKKLKATWNMGRREAEKILRALI